jgi:hypothetical protein
MEVANVASYYSHAMNERCCGDQGISLGAQIWHVKSRTLLCDQVVDRQHAARKSGQYVPVKPQAKNCALPRVAGLHE